jgi:hypothetical protein
MPLAPICIFYCKQCNIMYEYKICWFSRFGFPSEKSRCNVCIFHCIFFVLFLISVCSRYCTRLEFTQACVKMKPLTSSIVSSGSSFCKNKTRSKHSFVLF